MHVIDTDYENYEIRFSKANFAGVDYMEAVWIGARKPLRMGSNDYQEWYALVEQRMAELIPSYAMRRLSLIRQSPMCMY